MFDIYFYRIEHALYKLHIPLFPSLIKILIYLLFDTYIPYEAEIGSRFKFGYGSLGIILHPRLKLEKM